MNVVKRKRKRKMRSYLRLKLSGKLDVRDKINIYCTLKMILLKVLTFETPSLFYNVLIKGSSLVLYRTIEFNWVLNLALRKEEKTKVLFEDLFLVP